MSRRLFDDLPNLAGRLAAEPRLLLGLDYDGTLTPIVAEPAQARLSAETRALLQALASRPKVSVAIISGRKLEDVQSLVDVPGLIYAGNHGFEISGPGFRYVEAAAAAAQPDMKQLAAALATRLERFPGAQVEDKGLTLSVHFRRVEPHEREGCRRLVEEILAAAPGSLRSGGGNMVIDVRPDIDWHKGRAAQWIAEQIGHPRPMPLYFGDDETDEDAFAALSDGVTVRVGDESNTSALYRVANHAEVAEFLRWFEQASRR